MRAGLSPVPTLGALRPAYSHAAAAVRKGESPHLAIPDGHLAACGRPAVFAPPMPHWGTKLLRCKRACYYLCISDPALESVVHTNQRPHARYSLAPVWPFLRKEAAGLSSLTVHCNRLAAEWRHARRCQLLKCTHAVRAAGITRLSSGPKDPEALVRLVRPHHKLRCAPPGAEAARVVQLEAGIAQRGSGPSRGSVRP